MPPRILTIGEGDFSFTLTMLRSVPGDARRMVTATSYDTREEVVEKYPESAAVLDRIVELGARVAHRVDATDLWRTLGYDDPCFDRVIFHHPHCGVEDAQRHRILLAHYFASALDVLAPLGEIVVSLVDRQAQRWSLLEQADKSSLVLVNAEPFGDNPDDAGYQRRRHQGRSFHSVHRGNETLLQTSIEFVFARRSDGRAPVPIPSIPETQRRLPFPCTTCSRAYATEQGLREHVRSGHHAGQDAIPALACDQCGKGFRGERALKSHQTAKHGSDPDIKPDWFKERAPAVPSSTPADGSVTCDVCRYSFPSGHEFDAHLRALAPDPVVRTTCPHCSKTFSSHHSIRQHLNFCRAKQTDTP
ncbi:C2H2-type domain-containing protein [Plasmodiophora brassicae]|uniref:C2H2-type domain-containing protein n=1 Tax=Plasmodiophora brassicae TaxID=37360 RepID=A0A0G4ITR1_PLABS|nr:hypothetical protein PBRA_006822 [Plasmodiophora brassicae]